MTFPGNLGVFFSNNLEHNSNKQTILDKDLIIVIHQLMK